MPVKLLCGCPRRAAAEKGVKHNAAFRTARLDTGFGKFWRERGEMPALVGNGIDFLPLLRNKGHKKAAFLFSHVESKKRRFCVVFSF